MRTMRILATIGVALLLSAQQPPPESLDEFFGRDSIVISAESSGCWFFDVYVASERAQQMRGLMFVRELPDFTGMIFVYRQAGIRSMWMKNTYIPLDMLFVKGDGTVSSVAADTTPHSLESVASREPVNFVIELNAGMAARLGVGAGSRVIFSHVVE